MSILTIIMNILVIIFTWLKLEVCGYKIYSEFINRNWYGMAIPFISLGVILKYNIEKFSKVSNKIALIGIIMGVGAILEALVLKALKLNLLEYYMSSIICVVSIIIYSYNNPNLFSKSKLVNFDGNWTMYVYIIHPALIRPLDYLARLIKLSEIVIYDWIRPILFVVITLALSILINKVVKIIKIKRQKS